jgi:spore coat polysaccharide biosynthesis predicted glycosyltransferase SpsG
MRIVFRADASRQIGAGHVMRVSTIAQEAIARGYECHFVGTTSELSWVDKYLRQLGFKSLNQNVNSFDTNFHNEILVLDSYTIPLDSPFNKPNIWQMVVCVSDQFTPNYSADIFINQSMKSKPALDDRLELSGPDFALIRKSIKKSTSRNTVGFPPKLLVLGGGSDPYRFVRAVLQKLSSLDLPFVVHVFSDENLDSFLDLQIYQHQLGPELDEVANDIDLVITTASTSSIEFIAREIPTLVACAVDNQEKFYSQLTELGYAIPIGKRDSDGEWQLDSQTIKKAIEDPEICLELQLRIRGVIDLMGPSRIVDEIESRIAGGKFRG